MRQSPGEKDHREGLQRLVYAREGMVVVRQVRHSMAGATSSWVTMDQPSRNILFLMASNLGTRGSLSLRCESPHKLYTYARNGCVCGSWSRTLLAAMRGSFRLLCQRPHTTLTHLAIGAVQVQCESNPGGDLAHGGLPRRYSHLKILRLICREFM